MAFRWRWSGMDEAHPKAMMAFDECQHVVALLVACETSLPMDKRSWQFYTFLMSSTLTCSRTARFTIHMGLRQGLAPAETRRPT
jgi:hypothetical protein